MVYLYHVVKYSNILDQIEYPKFERDGMNLVFSIYAKAFEEKVVQKEPTKDGIVEFYIDGLELRDIMMKFEQGGNCRKVPCTDGTIKKVKHNFASTVQAYCEVIKTLKIQNKVLIPICEYDLKSKKLHVGVNEECKHYFAPRKEYTTLELDVFTQFKKAYTQRLYCLLRHWYNKGKFECHNLCELKKRMGVKEDYNNGEFQRSRLEPALEEIRNGDEQFSNLRCEIDTKNKPGAPWKKITFLW